MEKVIIIFHNNFLSCCVLRLFFLSKCCRGQNNIINIIMLYLYYVIYVTAQSSRRLRKIIMADDSKPGTDQESTDQGGNIFNYKIFPNDIMARRGVATSGKTSLTRAFQSAPSHSVRQAINCSECTTSHHYQPPRHPPP